MHTIMWGCIRKFPDWVDEEITLITINICWEATQRVMAAQLTRLTHKIAKLTRLTHKIAIPLHLVAESCTICSSRSRQPVRKLLDTPSYVYLDIPDVTYRTSCWLHTNQILPKLPAQKKKEVYGINMSVLSSSLAFKSTDRFCWNVMWVSDTKGRLLFMIFFTKISKHQ
jgi:hypothetical protein